MLSVQFDVIVCDGFAGNVALKTSEGVGQMLFSLIKRELTRNLRSKLGALLLKPALRNIVKSTDYSSYGGAILLGVNAPVVKGHGSSNAKAFSVAILQTAYMVKQDVVGTDVYKRQPQHYAKQFPTPHRDPPIISYGLSYSLFL